MVCLPRNHIFSSPAFSATRRQRVIHRAYGPTVTVRPSAQWCSMSASYPSSESQKVIRAFSTDQGLSAPYPSICDLNGHLGLSPHSHHLIPNLRIYRTVNLSPPHSFPDQFTAQFTCTPRTGNQNPREEMIKIQASGPSPRHSGPVRES